MSLKTKNKDRLNVYHNELLDRDRIDTHVNFVDVNGERPITGDLTLTGNLTVGGTILIDGRDPLRYALMTGVL